MSAAFRWAMLAMAVAVVLAASFSQAGEPKGTTAAKSKDAPKKPQPKITISKETTFITGPLRPDGYPDYIAALNELAKKGVTPESNAAVLFWQAFGPQEIKEELRERFFRALEIPMLPAKGDYLIWLDQLVAPPKEGREPAGQQPVGGSPEDSDRLNKLYKQQDTAMSRPWSKEEFPIVAEWLQKNEKPLALVVEGTKRARCYVPLVSADDSLLSCELPALASSREAARALRARAMLRLQAGRVDEAWQDLLACHRLARLIGQGQTLIDMLVAIALDGIADQGEVALVHHAKLTADQLKRFRADLDKLPPPRKFADVLDAGERFSFLDCVCLVARLGPSGLAKLLGSGQDDDGVGRTLGTLGNLASSLLIDWNEPLRMGNRMFDRYVKAARRSTRAQRAAELDTVDDERKKARGEVEDLTAAGISLLTGTSPRALVSKRLGQVFVALLMPALSVGATAEDRGEMQFELTRVALALAAYRVDQGKHPEKLSELSPRYLAQVPKDRFTDAELHYQRQNGGYLLYSVGRNGTDDGGRTLSDIPDDSQERPDWDDLVIRTPVEKH